MSRAARDCADHEVDLDVGGNREALVGMHLFALIPGQGASQLLRQLADVLGKRSNNSRRVLAGDLDEHREAGIALDEGSDVRVVRSGKKVSFPMPRHSAILNLGGPLADRDHKKQMRAKAKSEGVAPAMAVIHSIYRYPVKGLSPEALPRIALAPGETVPGA